MTEHSERIEAIKVWLATHPELSTRRISEQAEISRESVDAAREGSIKQQRVIRALEQFIEDFEAGRERAVAEAAGQAPGGTITFTVRGHFGVEATVAGPVENLAELNMAVRELIADLKADEADSPA